MLALSVRCRLIEPGLMGMAMDGGANTQGRLFLSSLASDRRGNTVAMMAIALIPLLAFAGSTVDTARTYMVKNRLQQACDAGVLAGRKFMASTGDPTLDDNAKTQAQAFFRNNFKVGIFGTTNVVFTPTKTGDNQVAGTATVVVPMTLTTMMGFGPVDLRVNCEARFDVADVDVMFVLDTTGSMAYTATDTNLSGQSIIQYSRSDGTAGFYQQEKSKARIKALRTAVLNFYDTLATSADASTNIRYGFVPYTSTVNVGKIIPASMLVSSSHAYSSRRPFENDLGTSSNTYYNMSASTCNSYAGRNPGSGYDGNSRAYYRTVAHSPSDSNRCIITTRTVDLRWTFGPIDTDVSQYMQGGWVADPTKLDGSQSKWQGCIEERDTTASASFSQSSLPNDLNPDLPATSQESQWRPMWPDVIYRRSNNAGTVTYTNATVQANSGDGQALENMGATYRARLGFVSCGKEAQRLKKMDRSEVSAFVNHPDFVPIGGTYHDVGMIWGLRLINPSGPFAGDTAAWAGRNPPIRHIVFMTDGEMAPNYDIYGLYGIERYDGRVTDRDSSVQLARHNTRFLTECQAAKARGITVWVVAFGASLNSTMQSCASGVGNAFQADNDTELDEAFQTIASRVAMLRISR